MKKVLLPVMALLVVFVVAPVYAGGNKVAYTWTFAILGEGASSGGGPLFADGTAGGNMAFSAENGMVIFHLHLTSWSYIIPGVLIDLCFDVHEIKGVSGFPPSWCLSDLDEVLPVTGTPLLIDEDGDGKIDIMMRATPAN